MQNMADVMRYVPGAGMAQGEGNRDTPILRGTSTTADFFVDGVRDDVQYFRDLYNVDSVEALKGPNAMMFGRGGAGGVINRTTRQADWSTAREITLQGGSFDNRRATFDLGQPMAARWSARLTGMYENSGSYRRRGRPGTIRHQSNARVHADQLDDRARRLRAVSRRPNRGSRYPVVRDPACPRRPRARSSAIQA